MSEPFELDLIAELSPEAPVLVTMHHGDPVSVIERRRRFARIRTASGVEGWTDGRMLLSAANMARLRRLSMNAARLPSQGKVTVYDALNIHTDPNRQAPSFYQMQEGNLAEVLAEQVLPREPYEPPAGEEENLVSLNSYDGPGEQPEGSVDDWSLVRLRDGRAGWALTRMLVMAIPDEVAQYAQGDRITSYASLGTVEDGGLIKHHWLWTTISGGGEAYQFDSFRVFVWSLPHHRYETAYVERNLVGYYPVEVHPPGDDGSGSDEPSFSLIIRNSDGHFQRRTYAFSGYRVHLTGKEPWISPARRRERVEYVELPPPDEPSLFQKLVDRVLDIFTS